MCCTLTHVIKIIDNLTPIYQWGDEIYNSGRHLFDHPYQILSFFDLCQAVMKKTFQEIMHFHDMARILPRPSARTPVPGDMLSTILGDPSLDIITIYSVYTQLILHTKIGQDWPSSSSEEDIYKRQTTDGTLRRTPTHGNRPLSNLKILTYLIIFYIFIIY